MKRFIRTIPGKVILFLGVILSFSIAAACVFGGIAIADAGLYEQPKESVIKNRTAEMFHNDAYEIIWDVWRSDVYGMHTYNSMDSRTNIRYEIYNADGCLVAGNGDIDVEADWDYYCYYWVNKYEYEDGSYGMDYDILWEGTEPVDEAVLDEEEILGEVYKIYACLDEELPVNDQYALMVKAVNLGYTFRYAVYPIGIAAVLLAVFSFIALMCVSARRPDTDELVPGLLNRVPSDVMAAAMICAGVLEAAVLDNWGYRGIGGIICIILVSLGILSCLLGFCMGVSARIKQKTLFSNTLTWYCIRMLWRFIKWIGRGARRIWQGILMLFHGIPFVWKTALALAGISILEYLVIRICWWEMDNYLVFWFFEKIIIIPVILFGAVELRILQKGGKALASGNLGYQVDTSQMFWDFKKHGENLNSIAEGMTLAVEERTKSERMKTELITNVSHDIKTPLTSIINYANLIGNESCENTVIMEYAKVLVRQSERLKRLIEDLVEASKAATGNLEVLLAPCEAEIFVTQISGEYEQKLKDAGLELITKQPEESLKVMADGRRMLRVFDNLMNNICKYAQSGTRVYLSLEKQGGEAVITFKNTSRAALDISADELMERFVRGDSSRNTEGNGLGLSIARSLTELQKGTMSLSIDGDLFKVTLRFPIAE